MTRRTNRRSVYLSDFTRKVIENKQLLIIGYSFGDLYLNEILGLGMATHGDEFKMVIVDKYPSYINDYPALYQHLLNHCNHGAFNACCFEEWKTYGLYEGIQRCGNEPFDGNKRILYSNHRGWTLNVDLI